MLALALGKMMNRRLNAVALCVYDANHAYLIVFLHIYIRTKEMKNI